jgi:hypothetical protein
MHSDPQISGRMDPACSACKTVNDRSVRQLPDPDFPTSRSVTGRTTGVRCSDRKISLIGLDDTDNVTTPCFESTLIAMPPVLLFISSCDLI